MALSEETKDRIVKATEIAKTVVHYAWVPFIVYFGYVRCSPRPPIIKLISPLS